MSTARDPNLPPENELEERFILAGGPGGQHVNRTESAVQLRYDARASKFLGEPVRQRLLKLAGRRASRDGVITIEARRYRSQQKNREDARKRLAALIERARQAPKKRVPTRPTQAARKKRLEEKRRTGKIKRLRRPPEPDG